MQSLNRRYLWLEFACLFGLPPLLILYFHKRWLMVGLLWGSALLAYHLLKRDRAFTLHTEWNGAGIRGGYKEVLLRFALLAPLLVVFTLAYAPDKFLEFPRERTGFWAIVMVLYPLLSVWPQELIFRSLIHHRYATLWKTPRHFIAFSALAFGFVHIIFLNWIAFTFTLIGGAMFARTYQHHRSLALVWLEHSLYGCLIFTIGLGWYFFGSAWGRH